MMVPRPLISAPRAVSIQVKGERGREGGEVREEKGGKAEREGKEGQGGRGKMRHWMWKTGPREIEKETQDF